MYLRLYLTCILLAQMSHHLHAKYWNVFLAAGQSNMVGSRDYSAIYSDGNLDSGISFYMVAGGFGSETVSGGWQTFADVEGKQGPERAFGRVLVEEGISNVAIVKYAINGSSLNDDFRKGALGGRQLYGSMLATFQSALSALGENGDTFKVHSIIWLQGTADTQNETRATSYEQNLADLVVDLRNDLGLPSLRFTTARHPACWSNRALSSTVRSAQIAVSLADPLVGIIDCEGTAHVGDSVHYDAESKEIIGKRFAYNYLNGGHTFFTYLMENHGVEVQTIPEADDDNDGRSNVEEYFWNTNPFSAADGYSVKLEPTALNELKVYHRGFLNDLDVRAEFLGSTWLDIGTAILTYDSEVSYESYSLFQLPQEHASNTANRSL